LAPGGSTPLHECPMKNALILLAAAAGVGLVATVATDPPATREMAASVAHGALYGVILGSNAWPTVPVDAQSRLLLWTANCKEECGLASTAPVDE
jgi:hypothetical protein